MLTSSEGSEEKAAFCPSLAPAPVTSGRSAVSPAFGKGMGHLNVMELVQVLGLGAKWHTLSPVTQRLGAWGRAALRDSEVPEPGSCGCGR